MKPECADGKSKKSAPHGGIADPAPKCWTPGRLVATLGVCILLLSHAAHNAGAQETPAPQPLLLLGDAVVTGFSGVLETGEPQAAENGDVDESRLFIDADGASLRGFDLSHAGTLDAPGQSVAPEFLSVTARDIGQVFGLALDDATDPTTNLPAPNIYVTATSAYGLPIVGPDVDGDGVPERLASGAADATWMEGLFGIDKGGGPGSVWKIDGLTGEVSLLTNIVHDEQANGGAALGNIAFDSLNRQFFVSDRDTGLIHRLDLDGNELETFDHGVTARGLGGLEMVPFDPDNRADISSEKFDPTDTETWGLANAGRRIWGLAVSNNRLFYAVAERLQIWSVGLGLDGSFDALTTQWELDLPIDVEPYEIADIDFAGDGAMILAQRAPASGAGDFRELVSADGARVLYYRLESPDDPSTASRWVEIPDEFAIGTGAEHRNATGGAALGYGYDPAGTIDLNTCNATLWASRDRLQRNPLQPADADAGGFAGGVQGTPIQLTRPDNVPPANAFMIDYDGQYPETDESGHVGDIEIAHRCPPDVLAGIPEAPGVPVPKGVPPPALPPPGVAQGPPPPGSTPGPPVSQYADLGIEKRLVGTCAQGQDCAFEIVVTNNGPADHNGPLVLTDTFSVPGVTLVGAVPASWTCQQAGNQINCNRPTLLLRPTRAASLSLKLRFTGNPNVGSWQNCVAFTWVGRGGDAQTVRAVQIELAQLKYYTGAIDGIAGSGTRKAIRDLEKALGLPQTGQITPALLEWLFGAGASTITDPNPANDRACVTVPTQVPPPSILPPAPIPLARADLAVEKGPSHPAISILNCSVDALCKFRVTITNKGPQSYTGPIIIKDQLLPGFTLVGWKGPSVCQQQGNMFSCGLVPAPTLAVNQSLNWDFELKLPADAPSAVTDIENCAELDWKGASGDSNKANDRGCTTVVVAPGPPHLEITKTGPKQCERGKDCAYRITVKNIGKTAHVGPISIEDRNFKAPGLKLASYGPKPLWSCTETSLGKYRCDQPAATLKPGDSLPALDLKVFIPADLVSKIDALTNCAAITQGEGKIGPESCITTPIKPQWDLTIAKSGPKVCYPEAAGWCPYKVSVVNVGKEKYEGPVKVIEVNTIKSIKLRSYIKGKWRCKDGPAPVVGQSNWPTTPAPGNITCEHPYVVLNPNSQLDVLEIHVDLHNTVPSGVTGLIDCALVYYKGGQPDADPKNDQSCITTPLHRGGVTITGETDPRLILGILFPINCLVVGITGAISGEPIPAPHLGCTDYEFTITNEGKGTYDKPLTLRVEIPPGSKFAEAHGRVAAPACPAGGWACSAAGDEIVCRPAACRLRSGEQVSVLTDITLLGGGRVHIPPEGLPKIVCGELEWSGGPDPSGIEQEGQKRMSPACGTTLVLLEKMPQPTDLQVATAPEGACAIGEACVVETSVTNIGKQDFPDGIEFQGQVMPPVSIRTIKPAERGWSCRTVGGGRYRCRSAGDRFAPDASAEFRITLAT